MAMSRKLVQFSQRYEYSILVGENFPESLVSDYWKMHSIGSPWAQWVNFKTFLVLHFLALARMLL